MKTNLTLKDVAQAAGVSTCIVSRALSGHKGVSEATRVRVMAVAENLGYRPSGAAAFLAQRRSGKKAKSMLVGYLVGETWTDEAFLAACEERGWRGVNLPVWKFTSPAQASRQLWQEGYDGFLVGAGPHKEPFWKRIEQFDWGKFPAVKMSRGLPQLALNLVRHSPFDYMMTTLETVFARGYRRFAVVLHTSSSRRDDQARLGAVLAFAAEHEGEPDFSCRWRRQAEPLGKARIIDGACVAWLQAEQPDIVVVDFAAMAHDLAVDGPVGPGKVAVAATLTVHQAQSGALAVSGCDQRGLDRYRAALQMLEQQILAGQRGFVANPREFVVEPEWFKGETLPTR